MGPAIYRGEQDALKLLRNLRSRIIFQGDKELLQRPLVQEEDNVTWQSTDPVLSFKTAQKLSLETSNQDLLFLTLGHGGIAAGMDVFNYYLDLTKSDNSDFYVIRFSRLKKLDSIPRISTAEKEYLIQLADRRQIVVYDEDRISGETLASAVDGFQRQVFPRQDIISSFNLQWPVLDIQVIGS